RAFRRRRYRGGTAAGSLDVHQRLRLLAEGDAADVQVDRHARAPHRCAAGRDAEAHGLLAVRGDGDLLRLRFGPDFRHDEPDDRRVVTVERVADSHVELERGAGGDGRAVRLDARAEALGPEVHVVQRQELAVQLGEASPIREQLVELRVVELVRAPVTGDQQVRTQLAVQLRARAVVVDPAPVEVLVIGTPRAVVLVRLLVDGRTARLAML